MGLRQEFLAGQHPILHRGITIQTAIWAEAFLSAEGGSYDGVRYSSTAGFGKSFETVSYTTTTSSGTTTARYQNNRPFAFFENSVSYKRTFFDLQCLAGRSAQHKSRRGFSRRWHQPQFLTVRLQPFSRIEFSAKSHLLPGCSTFDPQLVGTGLLDKYLFSGFRRRRAHRSYQEHCGVYGSRPQQSHRRRQVLAQ